MLLLFRLHGDCCPRRDRLRNAGHHHHRLFEAIFSLRVFLFVEPRASPALAKKSFCSRSKVASSCKSENGFALLQRSKTIARAESRESSCVSASVAIGGGLIPANWRSAFGLHDKPFGTTGLLPIESFIRTAGMRLLHDEPRWGFNQSGLTS